MATRKAIASGNWSDPAIWDGGVAIPDVGDDVYSNSFAVTIDQDVTVLSLRNEVGTGITVGGYFLVNSNRTVTANLHGGTSVTAGYGLITLNNISGTVTITGSSQNITYGITLIRINSNCTGIINIVGNFLAGGFNSAIGIASYMNSGNVNIVGDLYGGANGVTYAGWGLSIANGSSNTVYTITGNCYGSDGHVGSRPWNAVYMEGTNNTLNITGNLFGNPLNFSAGGAAVGITGVGNTLNVIGSVTSLSQVSVGSSGIDSTVTCVITVTGSVFASRYAHGINSSGASAIVKLVGNAVSDQYGMQAIYAKRLFFDASSSNQYTARDFSSAGSLVTPSPTYTLYAINTAGDHPAESDVRDGVEYAFSVMTGTLVVPPAASVALNVPVDNTVGAALLTGADIANAVGEVVGAKIQASFP